MNDTNNKMFKLLIVDDVPKNIQILGNILQQQNYPVSFATSGKDALSLVAMDKFDLILLDVMMPEMDGFEVCEILKKNPETKDIPVIFLTAKTGSVVKGFELGAVDYLTKPFDAGELLVRVKTQLDLKHYRDNLEIVVSERTEELKNTLSLLEETMEQTIVALATALEKRDPYTAGHHSRVSELASVIGNAMNLSNGQIKAIRLAGMVHDIGKISIPAEILTKPTTLTDLEREMIKTHPQAGYDILKHIEFPWPISKIVLQHHERIDGSGYPHGLMEKDILLEARVLSIADVLDAISSHRPYRPALGIDIGAALNEISQQKGIVYDSSIINLCEDLFIGKEFKFSQPK